MVVNPVAGSVTSRVILFGGQGSKTVFSPSASSSAKHDIESSAAGAFLLSQCHAAFLEDYQSLEPEAKQSLGINISELRRPEDMITHKTPYQSHGLIQATTICLYQLLHYIADLERSGLDFNSFTEEISEATGFCSGLISASIVASSKNMIELIRFGVEAFRLAFWIGCRTLLETQKINVPCSEEASWSLVIIGLNLPEVEESLKKFCIQTGLRTLQISAISSPTVISLSGPWPDLLNFKGQMTSNLTTKFAHVHSWYHGGPQLEDTLRQVLQDVERRRINFPGFRDLNIPIRSTHDGSILDGRTLRTESLAEWVTRHLLIYPVDWVNACEGIIAKIAENRKSHVSIKTEIMSFGPSTESLLAYMKNQTFGPNPKYVDRSSFDSTENQYTSSINEHDDIAIVGMGVNFPKGKGPKNLWETISSGLSAVSEVPSSRFDVSEYYAMDDSHRPRTMPVRQGAFLDDVWGFDNSFFNISPREAKSMDPQQRIILTTTQAALEDAGYVGDATASFSRASTGCYIGLATGDYVDNLRNDIDVFYSPGTLRAFHSGKISYVYKLGGPCMTIDTACSSSLVSIYQACRALQSGDCTAAIAGGANVISSPDMYLGLSRGHFLSKTGGCKPFDEAADGYGRAEGCGIFILKRLRDAIMEKDRIHGIIKGVEVNQSGNSHSITHPHSETQMDLIQRVLEKSNINPASISVVEAHGTGTQAGDTCEINSLRAVFEKTHSMTGPLVISSIKGNIGHCEAASGAAGLAKLLLMLRMKEIPLQASLSKLNPQFGDLGKSGIIIPRRSQRWEYQRSWPRRALLNNFGAAGSNAALLLEERIEPKEIKPESEDRLSYVFNLSAKSREALIASVHSHQDFFASRSPHARLKDVCYTATARRQLYNHRLSIICSTVDDLRTKLGRADLVNTQLAQNEGLVVFFFSGQGSLYYGMGKLLMKTSSLFRKFILQCDNIVRDLGFLSILDFLYGTKQSSSSSGQDEEIVISQCACVALEYALAQLLISWNIRPDFVAGHSLGEYAALAVSGAISLADSLYIVANRAQLMTERCIPNASGMVVCKHSPSKIEELLAIDEELSQVSIACRNSNNNCVVAGPLKQLEMFEKTCIRKGIKARRLDVPYGFHSSSMDPITEDLLELGKSVKWSIPSIPVASNVLGRLLTQEDCQSDYFARHARQPVFFDQIIQQLSSKGVFDNGSCLEIGPHPTTLPMIRAVLDTSCQCFPTMQKESDPWAFINAILSHFFKIRDNIDWRQLFEADSKMIDLPGYPLTNASFTVPYQETSQSASETNQNQNSYTATGFVLLPRLLTSDSSSQGDSLVFETSLAILGPLISGHNVGGTAICPASVFYELALEAAHVAMPPSKEQLLVVREMSFINPLIYKPEDGNRIVRVQLFKIAHGTQGLDVQLKVVISVLQDDQETQCCTAFVLREASAKWKRKLMKDGAMIDRQTRYFSNKEDSNNTFQKELLYQKIFARVVNYSAQYQSLSRLSLANSNYEAIGSFALPDHFSSTDKYITPPVFTDTLLHAAGFAANLSIQSDEIYICGCVGSIEILDAIDFSGLFRVYCSLVEMPSNVISADAFAMDSSGKAIAAIRNMEFKKLRLSSFQRVLQHSVADTNTSSKLQESSPEAPSIGTPDTLDSCMISSPNMVDDSRQGILAVMDRIVGQLYGSQDLDHAQALDELGIDSLMQIEMASKLKEAFPESGIEQSDLLHCKTLQALADLLVIKMQHHRRENAVQTSLTSANQELFSGLKDSSDPCKTLQPDAAMKPLHTNPLLLNVSDGTKLPIYLIHDGSGLVGMYGRICNPDRDVFAFYDPDFSGQETTITSLEQMAERYASCLNISGTPSLIIGGWSFGGVVAFQAARWLSKAGFQVKGLVLIDSPCPRKHEPLPEKIVAHILKSPLPDANTGMSNIINEFKHNASLLAKFDPLDFDNTKHAKIKTVYLQSQETFDTEASCGLRYDWLSNQQVRTTAIRGWEVLVGDKIEVLPVPGNHFQPFDPEFIAETSAQLRKACLYIEDTT